MRTDLDEQYRYAILQSGTGVPVGLDAERPGLRSHEDRGDEGQVYFGCSSDCESTGCLRGNCQTSEVSKISEVFINQKGVATLCSKSSLSF